MAEPRRDKFSNNFVGDLVWTERGWTVVPPTCCPAGHDYARPGLVGQLGLVQLQRPTHGVALLELGGVGVKPLMHHRRSCVLQRGWDGQ
ncbi:MAG: hypothetical protein WCF69_11770 [Mycobacterium sp.]